MPSAIQCKVKADKVMHTLPKGKCHAPRKISHMLQLQEYVMTVIAIIYFPYYCFSFVLSFSSSCAAFFFLLPTAGATSSYAALACISTAGLSSPAQQRQRNGFLYLHLSISSICEWPFFCILDILVN